MKKKSASFASVVPWSTLPPLRDAAQRERDEAVLRRIFDATVAAGGVLANGFDYPGTLDRQGVSNRDRVGYGLFHACGFWLPRADRLGSRKAQADHYRRHKRLVKAAQTIQRELSEWDGGISALSRLYIAPAVADAKDLEQRCNDVLASTKKERAEFLEAGSILAQLVGRMVDAYEFAFEEPPGYTTNPVSGETDGPFIRFVEQTLHEFGVTRDGNQPYQRRTIAAALSEFKKLKQETT